MIHTVSEASSASAVVSITRVAFEAVEAVGLTPHEDTMATKTAKSGTRIRGAVPIVLGICGGRVRE